MVERMITAEEKTQERFPDWNNRDNLTDKIIEIMGIKTENVGLTTLWR
jgi:hypothetical protein